MEVLSIKMKSAGGALRGATRQRVSGKDFRSLTFANDVQSCHMMRDGSWSGMGFRPHSQSADEYRMICKNDIWFFARSGQLMRAA